MSLFQNGLSPVSPDVFRHRVRWALGVARRGKWMLLGCLLLVMVPVVLYLYKAERLYSATSEVLIEAPEMGDSLLDRSYGNSRLTEASIQTEADIISSTSLAAKAIDKLHLEDDPEFNATLRPRLLWKKVIGYLNPLPYLTGASAGVQTLSPAGRAELARTRIQGMFLSRLQVKSHRRSYVISVTFTANNGEKAARIANTLAELYVVDRLDASLQEAKRTNDWLAQRLEGLRRDVVSAEQAAEQYRIAHNLAEKRKGERLQTVTDQQLVELNSRLVLARADLAQKQARVDQVRALLRNPGGVDTAYDVLQSPLIQRLREQQVTKQRELSEAMKTYGENHPRIIGQRADLQELQQKISQEINKIVASLSSEMDAARVNVSSLEQQISQLKRSTDVEGTKEVGLRELERQAETSRTLYEAFLSRYKRDAEQERIQRANARVLSQAIIPVQPSSPHRLRVFFAGLLVALGGGLGLVFLLDRLNGRVRSPEEAEQISGLPFLAAIPRRVVNPKTSETLAYSILDAPRSSLANAFRSLRAVLAAAAGPDGGRVTLVTSSVPQEGKSFVTRNLALAIAATGSRVLVIDADLMRPTQHLPLGVEPRQGLTQLLAEEDPLSKLGQSMLPKGIEANWKTLFLRDERGGFDILPAGPIDVNSGNALANGRLDGIVTALLGRYDRIFIDAPPSLAATDAQILTQVADQLVFVIKWNETARDAVTTALSYLTKVGANISGVVLTHVDEHGVQAKGYGGYGYYGGYDDYVKND